MKKYLILILLLITIIQGCIDSDSDSDTNYNKDEVYTKLHVKSPEWEEQIIYFILTDRFNDGDVSNNSMGFGEYNPNDLDYYSGGDLKGVTDKIDYIKNLGMTAVWITPPVANKWIDNTINVAGYHGYWGRNFKTVDEHLGTLDTYKKLSNSLHENQMYLIQDIVPNHTANFFTYEGNDYDFENPGSNFGFAEGILPITAPTQYPFNMNDYNNEEHREAGIYHWTPSISDYMDEYQEKNYQMGDLDDLNTSNSVVREALKDSYSYWIKEVGVDAFRVDTVKFIEHEFWNDFIHSENGILNEAKKTGRNDFFMFGEVYEESQPYSDNGEIKVTSFLGTDSNPELPAVINFPMHTTIMEVFGLGKPTDYLSYRINLAMNKDYFKNPYKTPVFIDNHDISRFRSKASLEATKQAIMFILTIPGIPIIYQGTEQEFIEQRGSMFKEGYGSGNINHFNESTEMFQFIKQLAELRKSDKIFTRGTIKILSDNKFGAGVFAYEREYENKKAIVIYNTSDNNILLSGMDTKLDEGMILEKLFSINQYDSKIVIGKNGKLSMELPKRSALILEQSKNFEEVEEKLFLEIETDLEGKVFESDFEVILNIAEEINDAEIVIDDNLDNSIICTEKEAGRWSAIINLDRFSPGESEHTLKLYSRSTNNVSESYSFKTVYNPNQLIKNVSDPEGDDKGILGNYTLPTDASFGKQMDIINTKVAAVGTQLEITITMNEITNTWNPKYGFDHVVFNVFIDCNKGLGIQDMPNLNYKTENDFLWDYHLFLDGWKMGYYSYEGADSLTYGNAVTPAPSIKVNKENNEIKLIFSSESIGNPETLEKTKIYITTWDYDGNTSQLRPLTPNGGNYAFGGGDGEVDPLIADSTEIIILD